MTPERPLRCATDPSNNRYTHTRRRIRAEIVPPGGQNAPPGNKALIEMFEELGMNELAAQLLTPSEGVAKTTINAVKSLFSTFVMVGDRPFIEHPLVSRLLKGVVNLKPSLPSYEEIWDPKPLLEHLQSWGQTRQLSTDKLNRHTACLFLLATGQRLQWGRGQLYDTLHHQDEVERPGTKPPHTNIQGV